MYDILSKCHETKTTIYSWTLNISVLTTFLLVTFCILYFCHRNKPSPEELKKRMLRDQYYVLQQIKSYQQSKNTGNPLSLNANTNAKTNITNLPNLDSGEQQRIGIYNPNILY
jgi:hypothetical protein